MPLNAERRTALATAAVDVIAGQGMRGLTHRAVDAAAGVPTGTASNYFPRRADLLAAAADAARQRLRPAGTDGAASPRATEPQERVLAAVAARLADRDAALAWVDLRLQAARDGAPAHDDELDGVRELPGTADDHRRIAAALDGVLLAALTRARTDAEALADAEALVRATPRRGWLARVGLR